MSSTTDLLNHNTTDNCASRFQPVRPESDRPAFHFTGVTKATNNCSTRNRPGRPYSTLFIVNTLLIGVTNNSPTSGNGTAVRSNSLKRDMYRIVKTGSIKSERNCARLNMNHISFGFAWTSTRGEWDTTGRCIWITPVA